jgi:anaerobic ribonucleoside-triphosphate reductase activating protein
MNYHNILHDDMRNGEGLRVVLFVSGCPHHCDECQNPQTWDCQSGIEFDGNALDEIFEELKKDYISGLTISGGDPLYDSNLGTVLNICSSTKKLHPDKTVWIYTGYSFEELMDYSVYENDTRRLILKYCDVLVDGRYDKNLADVNYPWAGSTNQKVIDVQKSLKLKEIVLWTN